MTSEASWHHVKSQENPADCASREDVKCEEKSSTVLTNVSTSSQGSYLLEIIAKYSSFSRLIRVIAWCKDSSKIADHLELLWTSTYLMLHSTEILDSFWQRSSRKTLSKCQTCFRFKAKSGEQLMGNLPANRLSADRAFLNTGIDFGGPFITKPNVSKQSKIKILPSTLHLHGNKGCAP
ncbi:hypothetical protein TNCV_1304791 [Trichonephila clavipes]|nr:hypothetical protein TNCV_1304791 [Trichonephila clavipes]